MKRLRSNTEEGHEKRKKICQTRWAENRRSSTNEQRSGVVTVNPPWEGDEASSSSTGFKPRNPTPPPLPPPTSKSSPQCSFTSDYLLRLRKLAFETLLDSETIHELYDQVAKRFLTLPTKESWNEDCESVLTVLYMALYHPVMIRPSSAKEIVIDFIQRCLGDSEIADFASLPQLFRKEAKYADLSVLLLFLGHLFPSELELHYAEESLSWRAEWSSSANAHPPEWLLSAVGCTVCELRQLLFGSLVLLKGSARHFDTIKGGAVFVDFLLSCMLYKKEKYTESLTFLQDIVITKCERSLQGWILWLMGLVLSKLGKYSTALVKLQSAVDTCNSCFPAIFNVAQVFHLVKNSNAEIETLALLTEVEDDWLKSEGGNLQCMLLRLHHPPPDSPLSCVGHFMLATRCLQMKMYEDACSNLKLLLKKLPSMSTTIRTHRQTLFMQEDIVPSLPTAEIILALQVLTYFQCENYEAVSEVLDLLDLKDLKYPYHNADSDEEKMLSVSRITTLLICSEVLSKQDRNDEAFHICVRMEQELSRVKGHSGSSWETCMLMLKSLLYSKLSALHELKKNTQSQHYKRLAAQILGLLSEKEVQPSWGNLSMASQLIMENVYQIINDRMGSVM